MTESELNLLYSYVQRIAEKEAGSRITNTVEAGTVTGYNGSGYTVEVTFGGKESTVNAIPLLKDTIYKTDDYVYLIQAADKSTSNPTYYIFGLASETQEAWANASAYERFHGESTKNDLGTIDFNDTSSYSYNSADLNFFKSLNAGGIFTISGDFTCLTGEGEDPIDKRVLDYGLKITFQREQQDDNNKCLTEVYYLNTPYFVGQPFKTKGSHQKRVIVLENKDYNKITIEPYIEKSSNGVAINSNEVLVAGMAMSAGYLEDIYYADFLATISAQKGKDYFDKVTGSATDKITLVATPKVNEQTLSAADIQYYWFAQDTLIEKDNEYYLSIGGEGWRCLNTYNPQNGIGRDDESSVFSIRVWNNKSNIIELSSDNTFFQQYITKVKCVIKYKDALTTSEDFEVINYNKESFKAVLESDADPAIIFTKTNRVKLTCFVDDENPYSNINKDYEITYQWQKWDSDKKEYINITDATGETLTIKDEEDNSSNTTEQASTTETVVEEYEMASSQASFRCVAKVKRYSTVTECTSDVKDVLSKVEEAARIKQYECYKYYTSKSPYVTFGKNMNKDNKWDGDWKILDSGSSDLEWMTTLGVDKLTQEADLRSNSSFITNPITDNDAYNFIINTELKLSLIHI